MLTRCIQDIYEVVSWVFIFRPVYLSILTIIYILLIGGWLNLEDRLLDSLVVECWFNPQSRTASYQRLNKNGTSSSLVWHSILKREVLALYKVLRFTKM